MAVRMAQGGLTAEDGATAAAATVGVMSRNGEAFDSAAAA